MCRNLPLSTSGTIVCPVQSVTAIVQAPVLEIRAGTMSDLNQICYVCDTAWDGIWKGDANMFRARMEAFPEYGIVAAFLDGLMVGYVSIQITDSETTLRPDWNQATDNGYFTKTHDATKEWIHGAGLALTPLGSQHKAAGKLIEHLNQYMIASNKKGARFVTRLPGYSRHADMEVGAYALAKRSGSNKPIDPEIRLFHRYDFFVTDPPITFDNYVEGGGDPNSLGKSALVERLNPHWE
jgi:hypothetical protein